MARTVRAKLKLIEGLDAIDLREVPPMDVTIEYLGQGQMEGRRTAGYYIRSTMTGASGRLKRETVYLDMSVRTIAYYDVSTGATVLSDVTTILTMRKGSDRQLFQGQCQTRLDTKASHF